MKRLKAFAYLASTAAAVAATVFVASPASAIDQYCGFANGHCIYWGQSYNGSHSNVDETVYNFPVGGSTPYVYLTSGSGQGQYIGNNNGSDSNDTVNCDVYLWYDPAVNGVFSGPYLKLPPGTRKAGSQLGQLLNNIRAQSWRCYQS